jgi:hypothetical protein
MGWSRRGALDQKTVIVDSIDSKSIEITRAMTGKLG